MSKAAGGMFRMFCLRKGKKEKKRTVSLSLVNICLDLLYDLFVSLRNKYLLVYVTHSGTDRSVVDILPQFCGLNLQFNFKLVNK